MTVTSKIPSIRLWTQDSGPVLEFTLQQSDGSGVLDLTGATDPEVFIRLAGGTANAFTGAGTVGTIVSPATAGKMQYALPSAITDPGTYYGQVRVTLSGRKQSSTQFELDVKEGYGP